jgi:hypothetical protein
MLDEARLLPECGARDALLEQVASRAEALGDLDTAWSARCEILGSSTSHEAPRFETLFLCIAWCLAMSDRDPDRFCASSVLWQYKWVATEAPEYASVPRSVLERVIDDLDTRFIRAGWGRRAGVHKRLQLLDLLGEPERALELIAEWRSTPRDRGADCNACEADFVADLHAKLGDDEQAIKEARPIIRGRLSCATVPHCTFGMLLLPQIRLGRHDEARLLYDRGRRLVTNTEEGTCKLIGPYLTYAAFIGEFDHARDMLRSRLPQASSLRSDFDRADWFGGTSVALEFLARRGVTSIDVPRAPGIAEAGETNTSELADRCREIALKHAAALDARNGNDYYVRKLSTRAERYGLPPDRFSGTSPDTH